MTFAENLKRICETHGTNPTSLCKKLGLSTSKVSAWYGGSIPKAEIMTMLAKELDCSVMDFFMDEDDGEFLAQNDDEKDLLKIFRSLSRKSKHEFMSIAYDFEDRSEL